MKKTILFSLYTIALLLFVGCSDEDLPKGNFDRSEVSSFKAIAVDGKVTLTWTPMDGSNPIGYYVSWTSGSTSSSSGEKVIEGNILTTNIDNLINGVTYTFTVQSQYKDGRSGKKTVKVKPMKSNLALSQD